MIEDLSDIDIAGLERQTRLKLFSRDPVAAHRLLFAHRHPLETCEAQQDAISVFHSDHARITFKAFRGFAKTTMGEEGVLLGAGLRRYRYGILLGNTYGMAVKRLASIKTEIDHNRMLYDTFGDLRGKTWAEDRIVLSNRVVLECFGARQSLRGLKEDTRPDFVLIDDLEDDEWVRSPEAIEANAVWFESEFLPALADPLRTPIRWLGTPLAENCLLNQMGRAADWQEYVYPIKYLDDAGDWQPTWPAKYTLEDIVAMEARAKALGRHREFVQEYMCESESKAETLFLPGMFRYDATKQRVWQPVYAMVDPARTTKKHSAMTGWAVWSWDVGGRLTVWEAGGGFLKPDEVIDLLFGINERWAPIEIGVEEDGLNEWILQPIRDAQPKRGVIPTRPMRAPKGKLDFIRGLQPYFSSNSVVMVGLEQAFTPLTTQLLTFPRDLIDVPNALAYCLIMRAGKLVYEDFSPASVFEGDALIPREPVYLCLNADGSRVAGVMCQDVQGVVRVLADWIMEGQAGDCVADMLRAAARAAGCPLKPVIGPQHQDKYRNHGLVQALNLASQRPSFGVTPDRGRSHVKEAMRRYVRGAPALMVSSAATWTMRALAGGYSYQVTPANVVAPEAEKGQYRTLIEGIESFVGMAALATESEDQPGNWQVTGDGRRYMSARRN